jgi:UDP-sulfoquinovose synthase
MLIFVCGVDGYIGNAITQKLLRLGHDVYGFDNFLRRKNVKLMRSNSALPIYAMEEKEISFNEIYKDSTFKFFNEDITTSEIFLGYIRDMKPEVILNLAHLPSGPFSMISRDFSNKTLVNNILGHSNILWSLKEDSPDTHYITIGTTGEYDHYSNIDIEEGYFHIEHKGRPSNEMIYPRRPGSVYHCSKTASTYLIDYLAKAWELKCTDIQQSIVYGAYTEEIDANYIFSRLDTDEAFGTIVNRFIVQAILDIPMTIYGEGKHQRGFLSLNDSIQALMIAVENPAQVGRVQVWNQLSNWMSMREVAVIVSDIAREYNIDSHMQFIESPRVEKTESHYYHYVTDILKGYGYAPTRSIEDEVRYIFDHIIPFKQNIENLKNVIMPKINFRRIK